MRDQPALSDRRWLEADHRSNGPEGPGSEVRCVRAAGILETVRVMAWEGVDGARDRRGRGRERWCDAQANGAGARRTVLRRGLLR